MLTKASEDVAKSLLQATQNKFDKFSEKFEVKMQQQDTKLQQQETTLQNQNNKIEEMKSFTEKAVGKSHNAMTSNAKQSNMSVNTTNDNVNAKFERMDTKFEMMMNDMSNFFNKRHSGESNDVSKRKKPNDEPFTTTTAPTASNHTQDTPIDANTVVDTDCQNHECQEVMPTQCDAVKIGGEQDFSQIELSHKQDQNVSFVSTTDNKPPLLIQGELPEEPAHKANHHRSQCWRLQQKQIKAQPTIVKFPPPMTPT